MYIKNRNRKSKKPVLMPGDTVYEVFTTVRKAVIERAYQYKSRDSNIRETVYQIKCEDGSPSPLYYATDIGMFIFNTEEEAEKQAERFREMARSVSEQGRGAYDSYGVIKFRRMK